MKRLLHTSALLACLLLLSGGLSSVYAETLPGQSETQQSPVSPQWSPSSPLPLQPPLTIESSLTGLESLLDNWEMDSLSLLRQLVELQTIVEELRFTLTQSETLAEGLALSLILERSKTAKYRRLLIGSVIAGAVLTTGSLIWALSK